MHDTSCAGVMSASSFHTGFAFGLAVKIPDRVDDGREREVNDALLGTEPAQLRFAGEAVPEPAEVRRDVVEVAADDEMTERLDGGRAHFVAAADRERQAVSFEPAVGLEDDIRRRVVGIGMHGVGAHLILRRGKSEIENREIGNFHRG